MADLLSFALLSFSSIVIVVNPLAATLIFVSLTGTMDQAATTPKDLAGAVLSIDLGAVQKNWRTLNAHAGAAECGAAVKGNAYGLSARGLAINTGLGKPEEFPRFSRFWLEKPAPFARTLTVHAAMESESCTGAYRFVIRPGATTEIDVTARLFFRAEVDQVGLAPLTSMFLFSEKNRADFDDFRCMNCDTGVFQGSVTAVQQQGFPPGNHEVNVLHLRILSKTWFCLS